MACFRSPSRECSWERSLVLLGDVLGELKHYVSKAASLMVVTNASILSCGSIIDADPGAQPFQPALGWPAQLAGSWRRGLSRRID